MEQEATGTSQITLLDLQNTTIHRKVHLSIVYYNNYHHTEHLEKGITHKFQLETWSPLTKITSPSDLL